MANGIFGYYTVEEINADPSILNGRTINGSSIREGTLIGLRLENVTLTNTTLHSIEFYDFSIKNVVFENCSFIKCKFSGAIEGCDLENVIFKGGIMANSGTPGVLSNITEWEYVNAKSVIFDNVSMRAARLRSWRGSVILRNMNDFRDYDNGGAILTGGNMNLRIDNCQLESITRPAIQLCAIFYGSTIYATNSKFTNGSGLGGSQTKATYIDNCEFSGVASLGFPQVMVVKNSILQLSTFARSGDLYFVNNKYLTCTYRRFEMHTMVNANNAYFINDDMTMKSASDNNSVQPIAVNITGGGANISNAELHKLHFMDDIDYINLRNVRILGGKWYNLNLKGGQWENVEIHAPIEIVGSAPQFGDDLKFYNVTYPQGSPFNSAVQLNITESRQPFAWPEVHVPTLEEMGIEPD
jgi:uncharacterized protein YjbI with pentapeptide repeats